MACGVRLELKPPRWLITCILLLSLNGLRGPSGIETITVIFAPLTSPSLNGLRGPSGIETPRL